MARNKNARMEAGGNSEWKVTGNLLPKKAKFTQLWKHSGKIKGIMEANGESYGNYGNKRGIERESICVRKNKRAARFSPGGPS